jgi:hypothetical protein
MGSLKPRRPNFAREPAQIGIIISIWFNRRILILTLLWGRDFCEKKLAFLEFKHTVINMRVTLIHTKSETCRELFEFDVDHAIRYNSYFISYRDNVNDIWGDGWREFHRKEIENIEIKIDQIIDETGSCYSYGVYELQTELQNKYWPTYCKTIRGETRLSGQSGGKMPKYPWNEDELKNLLAEQARRKILGFKVHVG